MGDGGNAYGAGAYLYFKEINLKVKKLKMFIWALSSQMNIFLECLLKIKTK